MPKSLGQIHTVSYDVGAAAYPLGPNTKFLIDLPGQLTEQLQHMVRMMSSFKVVGIDLALSPVLGADPLSCSASGKILYYAPTQGRVKALQMGYEAVRKMMKLVGVTPTHHVGYDFRPPFADPATFLNGVDFGNQAAIEDNGLASCMANGPGSSNIFGVYNQGIITRASLGPTAGSYEDGFDIGLRTVASSADYVLNEITYLQSQNHPTALETPEEIPFDVSFTSATGTFGEAALSSSEMEWRPDPALYLSVLTGQLVVAIDTIVATDENDDDVIQDVEFNCAVHVAGWKSILGSNKKRRHSKRRKSHGRKRRSKQ